MQAYGRAFARIYNLMWTRFANQVAPFIFDFYASTSVGKSNKSLLDLCCGTGQLAVHFLEKGFRVTGLDLSEHMLSIAKENALPYLVAGQAKFIQDDASHFALDERFGLVVSTFDALNHLENEQALQACFRCAHAVCDGYFIFDLNTRRGLRHWNNVEINDRSEDALIINHGFYDGVSNKAWTRITGFIREPNGLYERFDETVFNTAYEMENVRDMLIEVGWKDVQFARIQELGVSLSAPEQEERVWFAAKA
ncbi:MAG: class I SAM-dependent methyltransferase [Chloroflexi bacterium]|nr:class I SAM-dependent methyltransferase [Chloroflexota bacterium]